MEIATESLMETTGEFEPVHLATTVEELGVKVDALIASHNRILTLLESLESQFGPVMDGMKNGPIGKLMGL